MLRNLNLENVLFLDIETVPGTRKFIDLPGKMQALWQKKSDRLNKLLSDDEKKEPAAHYAECAGIYAEFGRIICISVGFLKNEEFRVKSYAGDDEKELLEDFAVLLNKFYNKQDHMLCAHNGKEFDYPYIARRMLVQGIQLPGILNTAGKKPWEVGHLDTMELWKFGDYKSFTSLDLLAAIFDIPTPKDDIDGSMVSTVYYEDNDLERIVEYCQKDTLTVAQLMLRYQGKPLIEEGQVVFK